MPQKNKKMTKVQPTSRTYKSNNSLATNNTKTVKTRSINKDHDYKWSKKVAAFALTIGIIEILTIIVQIIYVVLKMKGKLSEDINNFSQVFVGITSVVEIVFIIIMLCQWKSVKNATKLSHLWITVGYPVILGVALIFSLLISIPSETISSTVGVYAIIAISEILNALLVCLSLYIFFKIQRTIQQ